MRNAARMRLPEHAPPGLGGGVQQIQRIVHARAARRYAKGDRHAAFYRESKQPVVDGLAYRGVGRTGFPFARILEQAASRFPHQAHEVGEFLPRRMIRCHRPVVRLRQLVARRTRTGETDSARVERIEQFSLHRPQVIAACLLLECARAHDVRAQRRVPDVGGVVDRLGQLVHHIHVLPERCPVPADRGRHRLGGNILRARNVGDDQIALRGGTGRERESAVAHHHRGDAVPARATAQRIPEHLCIHVRMPVDKPG